MTIDIVLIAYALFLIIGGFLGFKKGSTVSLMMGVSSGILVLIGLGLLGVNSKIAWDLLICLAGLLSLSFISRLMKTRKFMPSGMMLVVSLAFLIFCLFYPHA